MNYFGSTFSANTAVFGHPHAVAFGPGVFDLGDGFCSPPKRKLPMRRNLCPLPVLFIAVSALGQAQPAPAQPPSPQALSASSETIPAAMVPPPNPAAAGFTNDGLQRIRDTLKASVDKQEFAGINVIIFRHGNVAMQESFGYMDMEAKTPLQMDGIFRIFSLTKPISATAAMICYDEGKFKLDEPVAKYLPAFANVKVLASARDINGPVVDLQMPMTIRNLLTHTSGLANDTAYSQGRVLSGTLAQMVDKIVQVPLMHQPSAEWRYSDGLDVIARLVEIWSGQTYDQFLRERIFTPLGMKDTGYSVPQDKLARVSKTYHLINGVTVVDRPDNPARQVTYFGGSSGLFSTAPDYLRFARMLLNGGELDGRRILKSGTVDMMMTSLVDPAIIPPGGPNGRLGYGYGIGGAVLLDPEKAGTLSPPGEFNWGGASSVFYWVDRKNDLTGVFFVQRQPWDAHPSMQFRNLTYQAMVGETK